MRTVYVGAGPGGEGVAPSDCWEPTGVVQKDNWKYVGQGRGAYSTVNALNHVGEGAGSSTKEVGAPQACMGRSCCACCALLMVMVGMLAAEWFQATRGTPDDQDNQQPSLLVVKPSEPVYARSITAPRYTCELPSTEGKLRGADLVAANEAKIGNWATEKTLWCCRTLGVACPSSTKRPFDCDNGSNWAADKTAWCCRNMGKGCATTAPPSTSTVRETTATAETTVATLATREPSQSTTLPPAPFNCLVELDTWRTAWPAERSGWCCTHYRRGCGDTSEGSARKSGVATTGGEAAAM